jgi:uncharacterized membrane protein
MPGRRLHRLWGCELPRAYGAGFGGVGAELQRRRGITVRKRWTWMAWSMLAIYVVGVGLGMPLMVANGEFQRDPGGQASLILALTAFMVVGAVIVAHRPGNAIG